MLQAGKLNRRATLQTPLVVKGTSGGMEKSWTDFAANLPAAVRNLSGNERQATSAGGGQVPEARTEFTLRWRSGITPSLRVVYGGSFYNIRHVNNFMERNEFLVLTCDTGVNDG